MNSSITAMQPADNMPAMGTVISQANAMFRNSFQDTPSPPRDAQPTHTTEPTLQWVVDTGRPALLANSTVTAAPTCEQNEEIRDLNNRFDNRKYCELPFRKNLFEVQYQRVKVAIM